MPDGRVEQLENVATYFAIEPHRRIAYAYVATIDGIPRIASLVTIELSLAGAGTDMSWTALG